MTTLAEPQSLGAIFRQLFPQGVGHEPLPNDAVCGTCDMLIGDHPEVMARMEQARERARQMRERDNQRRPMTGRASAPAFPTCRCARAEQDMIAAAHLPLVENRTAPATFENFELNEHNRSALEASILFAVGTATFTTLVFAGDTGNGKTHLLEAAARRIISDNVERRAAYLSARNSRLQATLPPPPVSVLAVKTGPLLDELRQTFSDSSGEDLAHALWKYLAVDVLFLDDLGAERSTDFAREQLLNIVNHRLMHGRRMAITTNLDPVGLAEKLDQRIASRLFDRNTGAVKAIIIRDYDHRTGARRMTPAITGRR